MTHRTEVLNTDRGYYGICSCGWHTPQAITTFTGAKLSVNEHRIAEALKAALPKAK